MRIGKHKFSDLQVNKWSGNIYNFKLTSLHRLSVMACLHEDLVRKLGNNVFMLQSNLIPTNL